MYKPLYGSVGDPNPDLYVDPDPDSLARGMDPEPSTVSSSKKTLKAKKNLDCYCFVTS
jgi:hypothetical protein